MSTKPFEKFIKKEVKGAKKKEAIRVEKKKAKEEARAHGEEIRKRNEEKYRVVTKDNAGKKKVEHQSNENQTPSKKYNRNQKEEKQSRYSKNDPSQKKQVAEKPAESELMPLNKFIAHAGVCARREAAEMVKEGKVSVNGDIIYEPGFKVSAKDNVEVKGKFVHGYKMFILENGIN